jgi:hypothetical protein
MKLADQIRKYSTDRYVIPARQKKLERFSIKAGDIVREMAIGNDHVPAVCSALRGKKFWQTNNLRLIKVNGPQSGLSTTVVCTYEFVGKKSAATHKDDPWLQLRGAFKNVFAELGGGEAYLRNERDNFYLADSSASREHE